MTEQAKIYQLEHGHVFVGTLRRRNQDVGQFKYGIKTTQRSAVTTVNHGLMGAEAQYEIETVQDMKYEVGDIIVLSHSGRKTRVQFCETEILDEKQLRFVPYEIADKVFTIGVNNLEE